MHLQSRMTEENGPITTDRKSIEQCSMFHEIRKAIIPITWAQWSYFMFTMYLLNATLIDLTFLLVEENKENQSIPLQWIQTFKSSHALLTGITELSMVSS